jgi:hypothetical protein
MDVHNTALATLQPFSFYKYSVVILVAIVFYFRYFGHLDECVR